MLGWKRRGFNNDTDAVRRLASDAGKLNALVVGTRMDGTKRIMDALRIIVRVVVTVPIVTCIDISFWAIENSLTRIAFERGGRQSTDAVFLVSTA